MKSAIKGLGCFVPDKVMTNSDFEKFLDTSDEWITQRTGIKERRIAPDGVNTSDLATEAAKIAIKRAGIEPKDIDLIICATATPDTIFPTTACWVGDKLGINGVPAFDFGAGCTGFIYGLAIADAFIRSGIYKNVLVIGAEVISRILDWEDRSTVVLFGDGAGAAVVGCSEEEGIMGYKLHADGGFGDLLILPARGTAMILDEEVIKKKLHYVKMKGNEIFKIAVREMGNVALELMRDLGVKESDIDWVVPHQANIRIIQALAKRLRIPDDKVVVNIHKYGNTSAASIPLALEEAVMDGRIKKGDTVLMVAFGAGLTWGSLLLRW